ncbi:DUF1501 domain-containing protein [Bremerella sp.]|uniref:DUF1501 domain-containing protein n=1 Tax=Bremerella sp. TaxID=2795602 RepID=UPI003919AAA9
MRKQCSPHEHLSRRSLLKGSLATVGGGTLMNWGGLFGSDAFASEAKKSNKRCILIWLNGGCSQFETFDMKVGRPSGGPFREISTNVAGTRVCELMPKISQRMDKLAVIRSMRTTEIDHPQGIYSMHTGWSKSADTRFPEIGAIVAKYCGSVESDLPDFVKISSQGDAGSGILGPQYQPFQLGRDGDLPTFSKSNLSVDLESRRHGLRDFVESTYAANHQAEPVRMHREAYERARRLNNVLGTFELEQEWEKYRDKYGNSKIGRRMMIAARLVEAGVAFVEVGQSGYDTHADNFEGHKSLVPPMEHGWAALIDDLEERGLLDDTLIVWMGEIGRTPKINNRSGRDHYVRSWSTALAGGGVKGGLVYGESDEDGVDVKSDKVTEADFFATIYTALGIDPTTENYAGVRPIPLAQFEHRVVKELLT